ncbi:hypothetical protein [Nitrobacter sp. JJSN]
MIGTALLDALYDPDSHRLAGNEASFIACLVICGEIFIAGSK